MSDCKKFCPYFMKLDALLKSEYINESYLKDYIKCYNYCNNDKKNLYKEDNEWGGIGKRQIENKRCDKTNQLLR